MSRASEGQREKEKRKQDIRRDVEEKQSALLLEE
jgi:hypothetical protein